MFTRFKDNIIVGWCSREFYADDVAEFLNCCSELYFLACFFLEGCFDKDVCGFYFIYFSQSKQAVYILVQSKRRTFTASGNDVIAQQKKMLLCNSCKQPVRMCKQTDKMAKLIHIVLYLKVNRHHATGL